MHVSALLHTLVALKPGKPDILCSDNEEESDDESPPVTSLLCQWKPPRKRKVAAMQVSVAEFEKYEYGRTKKYAIDNLETFDPRPEEQKKTITSRVGKLLDQVRGKGLCISLLLDPSYCVDTPEQPKLTKEEILQKVEELKEKLKVSEDDIREIELTTRSQAKSSKWFEVRRFRLTSSKFGQVKQLKSTTRPDNLVLSILGAKKTFGKPLQYGLSIEKPALEEYVKYQHSNGHINLYATASGFIISFQHPFLGTSPDASVYDPSSPLQPYGFAKIKYPYKYQDQSPSEAATKSDFMLQKGTTGKLTLKRSHSYYCQIQGQMGIGDRPWCDFIVYTKKGIHVERIEHDKDFWTKELLPKLLSFYDNCIAPEIVCPQHPFGLPLHDFRGV